MQGAWKRVLAGLGFAGAIASPLAATDWEGVFEGTLGKASIIVELNAGAEASGFQGGDAEGSRYTYRRRPYDLNLILISEGENLAFTETETLHRLFPELAEDDPQITGKWLLTVSSDGATGTWTSRDGKKSLPISLKRAALVALPEVPDGDNRLSVTYDRLWLADVPYSVSNKKARYGKIELRFARDGVFGTPFPRLSKFPEPKRMKAVNDMLEAKHREFTVYYRSCKNAVSPDMRKEYFKPQANYDLLYASPRLLSVMYSDAIFCGGAHDVLIVAPHTYDLLHIKEIGNSEGLDLSEQGFGEMLKLSTPEERQAFNRFAWNYWMANANKFAKAGNESVKDCLEAGFEKDSPEGQRDLSLALKSKGLAIWRQDYPTVAATCKDQPFNPAVVPWQDVKPWLKPRQELLVDEVK